MNGTQNDLQSDSQILVKFFVLRGFAFCALLEDGGNNFLVHVSFPRVYAVDSSSPSLLHVQKFCN